jgi:hypothetical protein
MSCFFDIVWNVLKDILPTMVLENINNAVTSLGGLTMDGGRLNSGDNTL